jgi:hypothetical protein
MMASLAVTAGFGLAACTTSGPAAGAAATTQPVAATSTANAGLGGPSAIPSGPPVVLADGRHAVYLTGLDVTKRKVTFDKIDFLTGADAQKEWKKQNPASTEDSPPNDYLIVNNNPLLRTLPIAEDVTVTIADLSAGLVMKKSTLAALPAHLAPMKTPKQLSANPFWLTVNAGQVTAFEEQYVP